MLMFRRGTKNLLLVALANELQLSLYDKIKSAQEADFSFIILLHHF
jgi:hypothetical protein